MQLCFGLNPSLILTKDVQSKKWGSGSTVIQPCGGLDPCNPTNINRLNWEQNLTLTLVLGHRKLRRKEAQANFYKAYAEHATHVMARKNLKYAMPSKLPHSPLRKMVATG